MTRESPTRTVESRRLAAGLLVAAHVVLALCFFARFGFNTYHPTDHGFVLGSAWRVFGGQVPYLDFVWVRPPGSLYLHSAVFWLPESWSFPAARLVFYLQLAAAAFVPAAWSVCAGAASPVRLGLLSLTAYAIALHNFPATGAASGVFLVGYGGMRFSTEFARQPDAHLGFIAFDWLTMGQLLSLPMVAFGIFLIWWASARMAGKS